MTSYSHFCQVTSVIWAVVSDGKQAYIFKYQKDETIFDEKILAIRGLTGENAGCPSRKPSAEMFGCKNETVSQLIPSIAAKLKEALDDKAYDYLLVVAPRETMSLLQNSLNTDVRNRMLVTMPEGYIYDKGGALIALREDPNLPAKPAAEPARELPPCCTRAEPRVASRGAELGSTSWLAGLRREKSLVH